MPALPRTFPPLTAPTPRASAWRPWLVLMLICRLGADAWAAAPAPGTGPTAPPPIRLQRSLVETNPHLGRGYDSFQAGRLEAAQRDYEQAWSTDPKSVDALLGLATIARRLHRSADAEYYYRLALEADPTNATALASLLGAAAGADAASAESQLKNLLSGQPQSGPLNFALGNLHSRQSRWRDARQSYFNALAVDGDNPDYLFNLAVTLDRLRQPGPAARHYGLALEAADRRPPAFDRELARKRLRELQP